jgi:hypothetical protein
MTTDKSHNDALTDRQRRIIDEAAKHLTAWLDTDSCDCDGYGHSCGRPNVVRTRDDLLELLAVFPVEQPTAAPNEVSVDCLEKLRALMVRLGIATNESLEGFGASLEDNLYRTIRAVNAVMSAAMAPTTPVLSEERETFLEWFCSDTPDKHRKMDKESADDCLRRGHANDRLLGSWEGFQFGLKLGRVRAASANETVPSKTNALKERLAGRLWSCRSRTQESFTSEDSVAETAEDAKPVGWLVRGESTHLYVDSPDRPGFAFINGSDPVVSIEPRYALVPTQAAAYPNHNKGKA